MKKAKVVAMDGCLEEEEEPLLQAETGDNEATNQMVKFYLDMNLQAQETVRNIVRAVWETERTRGNLLSQRRHVGRHHM